MYSWTLQAILEYMGPWLYPRLSVFFEGMFIAIFHQSTLILKNQALLELETDWDLPLIHQESDHSVTHTSILRLYTHAHTH